MLRYIALRGLLAIAVAAIRTPALQASVIMLVITTALVLQLASMPYVTRSLNAIESLSLIVLWLSAFSGMVLADGEALAAGTVALMEALVAGVNIAFLLGTVMVVAIAFSASIAESKEAAAVWLLEGGSANKHGDVGGCTSWPCRHGVRRGCMAWAVTLGAVEAPEW